jgi:hypothetical protein
MDDHVGAGQQVVSHHSAMQRDVLAEELFVRLVRGVTSDAQGSLAPEPATLRDLPTRAARRPQHLQVVSQLIAGDVAANEGPDRG